MSHSKKIDDGGLAFPGKRWQQVGTIADHGYSDDDTPTFDEVGHPGMSLRDYFAGQALAGICAGLCSDISRGDRAYHRVGFTDAAEDAYILADAMIAARKAGA